MISYHAKEFEKAATRSHPWSTALSDKTQAYIDFKRNPKAIRTSLEDYVPFSNEAFVESFYSLLEWLNSPDSLLESNDCSFRGSVPNNTDPQFSYPLKCQGRLMILLRNLAENCQPRSIDWLMTQVAKTITVIKPSFQAGAIGLSRMPSVFLALDDRHRMGASGEQIMMTYFAYGKNDKRCYENMNNVIECLHSTLRRVNKKLKSGELDSVYIQTS